MSQRPPSSFFELFHSASFPAATVNLGSSSDASRRAAAAAPLTTNRPVSLPRQLSGHATPPAVASGTNRVPIVARQTRHSSSPSSSATSTTIGRATGVMSSKYTKPFDVPRYLLKHTRHGHRFVTTGQSQAVPSATTSSFSNGPVRSADNAEMDVDLEPYGPTFEHQGGTSLRKSKSISCVRRPATTGEHAEEPIYLPTCWNEMDRCALLELSSDRLNLMFAGSAKYGDRDAAAVRADRPIPPQCGVYYFEVEIVDKGLSGYIGVGFSHPTVSLSRLPGWEDNSWGYHGDDGRAFCCLGTGESFGPTFTTGDVIGCGIDWTDAGPKGKDKGRPKDADKKGGARAFFTKNGEFLGYAFANLHGDLYPSVGLRTPGEVVKVNFGHEPFKFDIDALVRERKRAIHARISAAIVTPELLLPSPMPIIPSLLPPSIDERVHETLQTLISSYLVHHGYSETAAAFDDQVATERRERIKGLLEPTSESDGVVPASDSAGGETRTASAESRIRGEIRQVFMTGDVPRVIELVSKHYPTVLEQDADDTSGGMLFKLRLRAFTELVARQARRNVVPAEIVADDNVDMGGDDHSPDLDEVLVLGQKLDAEYSSDPRRAVQEALKLTFSLMAYDRPQDEPGLIGWVVSQDARSRLADELNKAILVSQSLPPIPHLESMFRHTHAVVDLLGECGSGASALVDVDQHLFGSASDM
ncbi:hypothetical protein OIV83_002290 [Microbotryomycetes sp. JL201]|nr:hypothetical protein OIV83_002290 [Microbotryomycetes sp. JL201]